MWPLPRLRSRNYMKWRTLCRGTSIEEQKLRAAAEERGDKLSQEIEEMVKGSRFR